MKPAKFTFAAASLVFTLVPPPVARLAVLGIAATIIALLIWAITEPTVLIGSVVQLNTPQATGQSLVAVSPLWPGSEMEVASVASNITGANTLRVGDLVIAFGDVQSVGNSSRVGIASILNVNAFSNLPLGEYLSDAAEPSFHYRIASSAPWLVVLSAIALTVYAPLVLRLGAGAVFAVVSAIAAFLLIGLNAQDGLLPIPEDLYGSLILASAAAGGVLAFKATIGDIWRTGERLAAPLLALALTPTLHEILNFPQFVAWGLPVVAFLFPVISPLALAAVMLTIGLDLDPEVGAMAFGALVVVRQMVLWTLSGKPNFSSALGFTPDTRRNGQFDLETLIVDDRSV